MGWTVSGLFSKPSSRFLFFIKSVTLSNVYNFRGEGGRSGRCVYGICAIVSTCQVSVEKSNMNVSISKKDHEVDVISL